MSREIKFRIWRASDEYNKVPHMESWDSLLNYSMSDIFQLDDTDDVLEQFTGLKDRNGKEIYEGDILKASFSDKDVLSSPGSCEVVQFIGGRFIAHPVKSSSHRFDYNLDELALEVVDNIVGNIHENKDLLKKDINK